MQTFIKKLISTLLVLFMIIGTLPLSVTVFGDSGDISLPDLPGNGTSGDQPIVVGPGGGDQPYEPVPDDSDDSTVVSFCGTDYELLNDDFYNMLYRKGTEYLILTRPNQDLSYTIGFNRDGTHIEVSEKRLSSPGHPVLLCPVPKEDGTSRPTEALKYRVKEAGDDDGWTDQSRYLEGINDDGVQTTDDFEDCPEFCFDWKNNLIAFYCVETGEHLCQNSGYFYFAGGGDPKPEESDFFVYQRVCPHEHTVTCPYTAPTCAQPGNKAYKYCEDCGSVLSTGGSRTYWDSTGKKHYYDENYFKIDTTDHDFRNGVCIYCGKSVAPDTVMVADQEYKLISDDFYNKYYFNATEYIVVMYSGRQFYALTEGLESEIAKDRGSYLFFEAAASLVPETDPDIGMRRPNNTLFYKVGEKYLKTDSSGNISLVDTAEESGTKYYFDVEDGEAVFGAYLENYPANKYYIDIPTNGYCSFTGNKAQVLIYQKVCEHPNAEVCAASENSCTKAGMRYHIYCPDCDTYEDEAHSRTYTADDGTIYRYMSCEDFITKPLGHRYCKYHTCSRCGTKARKYVKVTSDEMIVPSPKYRYILVDEFSGKILAADVSKAFDNEAMTLTRDGLSDGYIVNTSDGASVMTLEFCISPFVPEYPDMALPEDGTPLYTLISDMGYSILIQDELSIFYAPANGWNFKYPFGFFCDGENALLSSWNYGKWSEPAFNGESSFTLYRGEIEEDLGPVAEGEFEIEIEGGEAKFCGRNAAFAGSADLNDTLVITAYDYPGRTFKYWQTLGGETIPEREFKMLVRAGEKIWAVYEDASEFGAWTLVSDSTDCTVPKIFKQTNAEGDVRYKTVYVNGGFHSYGVAEPYDSEHHVSYCVFCGKPEYAEHSINEARMTVFPTHSSSGISVCTCGDCGDSFEMVIPPAEDHIFANVWTVVEPSSGGLGKRSHKCVYCDETETCWYIEPDLKSLLTDHYIDYKFTTRYGTSREERYYSYTRDDGKVVYVFAIQLTPTNNRDHDQTFIYMYIDDNDSETKEPVYLTKTAADSSSIMGKFVWAPYDYVRDFDGFIEVINHPDGVNVPGITQGNGMGGHGASLVWRYDDYAEEFNRCAISADVAPDSFADILGFEIESEGTAYAKTNVYNDGELIYSGGGFDNCTHFKIDNYGDGEYDRYVVDDDSGVTVYRFERASNTTSYFKEYRSVLTAEEYAALGENEKKAAVCRDDVATMISDFVNQRTYHGVEGLTLDAPHTYTAVRVQVDREVYGSCYTVSGKNWDTSCYSTNVAGVHRTEIPIEDPNEYALTFRWDEDNDDCFIFDYWEIYNFRTEEWEYLSDEATVIVNTYDTPLTDITVIRPVYHKSTEVYHISVVDGTFMIDGDDAEYTEADVLAGTVITLNGNDIDGMELSGFCRGDIEVEQTTFPVKYSAAYRAVYVDKLYCISAYVENYEGGFIYRDDNYEEGIQDVYFEGYAGDTFTVVALDDSENGYYYDDFLGWYAVGWDFNGYEEKTLITKDHTLTFAAGDYDNFCARWKSKSPEEGDEFIKAAVKYGYLMTYDCDRLEEDGAPSADRNAFSVIGVPSWSAVVLIDDPNDEYTIRTWNITYLDSEGEEVNDTVDAGYEYWFQDVESYGKDAVLFEGVAASVHEHEWDDGMITLEPTCTEYGEITYCCVACGGSKTESIEPLGHNFERSFTIARQPTPTSSGIRYHVCLRCDERRDEGEFNYIRGDTDGDSSVTAADVMALKTFLADGIDTSHICLAGSDLDGDGSYTARDVDMEKTLLAS